MRGDGNSRLRADAIKNVRYTPRMRGDGKIGAATTTFGSVYPLDERGWETDGVGVVMAERWTHPSVERGLEEKSAHYAPGEVGHTSQIRWDGKSKTWFSI